MTRTPVDADSSAALGTAHGKAPGKAPSIAMPAGRRWFLSMAGAGVAGLFPLAAAAQQAYPVRPVRLLVGASAGGGSDILARILAEHWTQAMGQPFVVENRPGAANTLAAALAARSPADGHTLLLATNTGQSIAPFLLQLSFDPARDLVPIGMVMRVPQVLLVGPGEKARSVAELVAAIRARPGGYHYASAGIGSTQHLAGVMLNLAAGIHMVHVPYKGSSAALPDLISGQVQLIVDTTSSAIAHVRTGKLRALAITTAARSPQLPEVPTMREASYPTVDITTWYGLYAPAGTAEPLLDRLHAALQHTLADPAIRARLQALGAQTPAMSRQQFADMNRDEAERYGRLLREAGIRIE